MCFIYLFILVMCYTTIQTDLVAFHDGLRHIPALYALRYFAAARRLISRDVTAMTDDLLTVTA